MLFYLDEQNLNLHKRRSVLLLVCFFMFFLNALSQNNSELLTQHIRSKNQKVHELISQKKFDLALNKLTELENYKNYIKHPENLSRHNLLKAKSYYGLGDQKRAVEILLTGLDEIGNNSNNLKIDYLREIGKVFKGAKNYTKALVYQKNALRLSELTLDTLNTLESFRDISTSFYNQEEIDSAIYYSNKIISYPLNIQSSDIISNTYNNLSVYAAWKDDLESAERYGNIYLDIMKEGKDSVKFAVALSNVSNIAYKKKDYEKVRTNYLRAYAIVENAKSDLAINLKEDLLYNLSYVNEELANYKEAYNFLEKATNLTDSLAKASIAQNISEIEAKYNLEKQAAVTEREKRKRAQAQALFYGTALAFLALLALAYIFYRNYRLKQQAKLDQVENESQTKIINATIDAKEKERKAIAETLHDSVSALLSSANLHLQATKAQLKQKSPQEITKAQTIVNEASVKIRDLSHELISSVLLKFGLAFAVHDMCQKYSNSELTLHSDDDGIKRYHQDFEIKIHNIIEELINNILKHSKASNATVMLAHKENDMLSVRISDDGVGFNPRQVRGKDGLGLSHIEARIKVMKGVFNIISSKDNGTNIFILVPIQFKESIVSA